MTTPALTQFSMLDPALEQKQIEAGVGHAVFDIFSALDPLRRQKQIEASKSKTIFSNYKGILDPSWSPPGLAAAIGA